MTAGINMKSKITKELIDKKLLNMNRTHMGYATCSSFGLLVLAIIFSQTQQSLIAQEGNAFMIGLATFLFVIIGFALVTFAVSTHISGWNLKHKEKVTSIWWIVNSVPLLFSSALCIASSIRLFTFIFPANDALAVLGIFALFAFLIVAMVTTTSQNVSKYLASSNEVQQQNIHPTQPRKLF